jgi:hypothetical protein
MPVADKTLAYVKSLPNMEDVELIDQFFKKKGPISRAEVALQVERKASIQSKKHLIWMRDALLAAFPLQPPRSTQLHERNQAPIYKAFDTNK